mgnify:CR=1 FL=1
MKRLIGVKELRALLESGNTIYETLDTINDMARVYASKVSIEMLKAGASKSRNRLESRPVPNRLKH